VLVWKLPSDIEFSDALGVAGKMGKLEVVNFDFDLSNRYTFWTGMLGGVFLFLSYFGTDQSQVQRYLSGKTLTESRLGLLFNGIFKVPMQFLILFIGVMVFIFFQFNRPPVHFNEANLQKLENTAYSGQLEALREQHNEIFEARRGEVRNLIGALRRNDETAATQVQTQIDALQQREQAIRQEVKGLIQQQDPKAQTEDKDYVFITFVIRYLPIGLVGLLLAVIFSAAMSSTASELNALATTTVVDIYRRSYVKDRSDRHYLWASKGFTILWGGIALFFAATADLFENLIQAVNIIGSLFYGTILGIFIVAFFLKWVKGRAVFVAAIIAELVIILIFSFGDIAYLWLNLIGCFLVMGIGMMVQALAPAKQ